MKEMMGIGINQINVSATASANSMTVNNATHQRNLQMTATTRAINTTRQRLHARMSARKHPRRAPAYAAAQAAAAHLCNASHAARVSGIVQVAKAERRGPGLVRREHFPNPVAPTGGVVQAELVAFHAKTFDVDRCRPHH